MIKLRSFLLISFLLTLVVGGLILIPNAYVLFVCRLIQGILGGFYLTIIPLYVREITPVEIYGSLGAINQCMAASGCFMGYLVKYVV